MWHVVQFETYDIRVLHDTHVDELENDFGPELGAKLLGSFKHKWQAEDFLDALYAE